ncbi:hypothetical protein BE04_03900 [Sorangium cellulosum]|uniref:Uncharacterized protein n=1 Tax=Sorangium cellulosum TaxID=56 RepID=A0A150PH19_SORCE|nr:hypothetical protein BE04_03900 [Sorangium cellulosum]
MLGVVVLGGLVGHPRARVGVVDPLVERPHVDALFRGLVLPGRALVHGELDADLQVARVRVVEPVLRVVERLQELLEGLLARLVLVVPERRQIEQLVVVLVVLVVLALELVIIDGGLRLRRRARLAWVRRSLAAGS